jgi:hypothetical protein
MRRALGYALVQTFSVSRFHVILSTRANTLVGTSVFCLDESVLIRLSSIILVILYGNPIQDIRRTFNRSIGRT